MTRVIHRNEGIVLHVVKYGDYDQIATLFTQELGVVKLIVKGGLSLKRKMNSPLTPLTRADLVFSPGRGEIGLCKEIVPLERFHHDQGTFSQLEASCALVEAIHRSQMLEKPAPKLYALLVAFLRSLKTHTNISTWISCFLLKVLKHDGLLAELSHCAICQNALSHDISCAYIQRGEAFCKAHAPPQPIILTREEIILAHLLTHTRNMATLAQTIAPQPFVDKVRAFFYQSLEN